MLNLGWANFAKCNRTSKTARKDMGNRLFIQEKTYNGPLGERGPDKPPSRLHPADRDGGDFTPRATPEDFTGENAPG
jgi:hypothetical protein